MFKIRPIQHSDVDAVYAIEERSFPYPFTREIFEAIIGRHPFHGLIAEDGIVVGYIIFSIIVDESELLTVAVDGPHRRKGIARGLIDAMFSFGKKAGVKNFYLEVRPSNETAIKLYSSYGFSKVGLRKGYYKDNNEDAIVMKKCLSV